jgi:hypothetical protein
MMVNREEINLINEARKIAKKINRKRDPAAEADV